MVHGLHRGLEKSFRQICWKGVRMPVSVNLTKLAQYNRICSNSQAIKVTLNSRLGTVLCILGLIQI